ncbi:glycosyltransferase family 4 protein [Roseivirga sp. E12]|uniref:glycosyltransferase family 4 protein n=1 Tax=Roseivirga sp. E12 TaxID=2819237 RepID=UPI001ABCB893|nr:glycosyltransferase family 4 protein [Roseivirga sp. E12]MBO3698361.1 glycosyltransferase family 4 protein [Roseivirga sp. E12]
MRVLFVQKEGGIFGAENYQLKVVPGLLAEGVQIEFLRLYTNYQGGEDGDFIDRLEVLGVKTYQVNIGKIPTLRVLNKIKNIANNGDFDIIHTHLIHADFHLALIKAFMKLQPILVSTKHGYDNNFTSKFGFDATKQTKTLYYLISRWGERQMDASYTISKGLLNFFIKTRLATPEKMRLIHYGFDMPENYLSKGDLSLRLASKQIIIAGRLIPFKGHEFLIRAMATLKSRYKREVKLLILGTGEFESHLRQLVTEMGLLNQIQFLGYSNRVGAYMANSDVVVVPSVSEGFGVVFLEAFSAKTPVISWDVPSGNELMENGKTGYLVPPYDVDKLAELLIQVLDNPKKQEKVAERAYNRLKSHFNLERMINETIEFYKKALST